MKIGIVTFTYGANHGQRLQNLAMQELLKNYGDEIYTLRQVKPKLGLKRKIIQSLKSFLMPNMKKIQYKREEKFCEFDKEYINYYYYPIEENKIHTKINEFDRFVVGSDQVWSPYSPDVNSTMFLLFTQKEKRICFAPSIAAEEIPDDKRELYIEYWNGFDYLSVRERKAASIIKSLSGKDAEVVVDPTLMFNDFFWGNIIQQPKIDIPKDYAFLYFLGNESQTQMEKINKIVEKNNLSIIDISHDNQYFTLNPSEFLYLVKNAKIVFTNSYHGTIFSLLFHIPFSICDRLDEKLNMNSRFETLNEKFDIGDRKLSELKDEDIFIMDFERFEELLSIERVKAKKYLDKCFGCGGD